MKLPAAFILLLILFLSVCYTTKQHNLTSGMIAAGGFQVYYERQGRGEALLLLHAGLQDHTMWKAQVESLSTQFEVVTIDLPFHGRTSGTDTTLLAQDVVRIVLDSLHLQKVSIVGLSMGASVVQDFIIAYPDRVRKTVLLAAGINGYEQKHPVDSVSMAWYQRFAQALEAKDTVKAAVEFTKAWAEGVYRSKDSLKSPASQYVYNTTLKNLRLHKMQGWPRLQMAPPAVERLASIKVPVLIIDGDKDLPYITAASSYMKQTIPGAKRILMKDVAHMLNLEKPAELNNLILHFLKEK